MSLFQGTILALLLLLTPQFTVPFHTGATAVPSNLNPCLISAWPMNEGSGTTLNDTSGHSNTATIGGTFTWQSNAGLPGITPNWTLSAAAVATNTALTNFTGTTPFSVSVWRFQANGTAEAYLGTLKTSSGFQGWELGENNYPPRVIQFFLINNFPSNAISVHGSTDLLVAGLYYLVATYDGSQTAAGVKLYVNGTLETMTTLSNTLSASPASGLPVRFNTRTDGTDAAIGPMAFAEVYNCVLTPAQIAANKAAGPGIY